MPASLSSVPSDSRADEADNTAAATAGASHLPRHLHVPTVSATLMSEEYENAFGMDSAVARQAERVVRHGGNVSKVRQAL